MLFSTWQLLALGKNSYNSQEFWNSQTLQYPIANRQGMTIKWPNDDLLTLLDTYLILSLNHICKLLYCFIHQRSESRCKFNWPDLIWTRNARMNSGYWLSPMLTWLFASSIRSYSKSSENERVLNVNIPEIVYSRKVRV